MAALSAVLQTIVLALAWMSNSTPQNGHWWNMTEATKAESLNYDEQITAFAAQGLFNKKNQSALMFFDIGAENYDWPHADAFWLKTLQDDKRVRFKHVQSSLCSLINASAAAISHGGRGYDSTFAAGPHRFSRASYFFFNSSYFACI